MVRALIELGADVDAEDENKETPLHLAAVNGKSFAHSPIIEENVAQSSDRHS